MLGFANIGPLEIAMVLIVALIVFGPKRLPELGNGLGRGIREFRSGIAGEKQGEDEEPHAIEVSPAQVVTPKASEAPPVQDESG
jgi:sec-independent protein translocase protein TatA